MSDNRGRVGDGGSLATPESASPAAVGWSPCVSTAWPRVVPPLKRDPTIGASGDEVSKQSSDVPADPRRSGGRASVVSSTCTVSVSHTNGSKMGKDGKDKGGTGGLFFDRSQLSD